MSDSSSFERASSFGYFVSVLGFGLCRAWIVFSLSVSMIGLRFTGSWVFLLMGALAAILVPVALRRFSAESVTGGHEGFRLLLFRITAVALLIAAFLIPAALLTNIWLLQMAGWIIGGVGAGLLQVLWGERFAAYPLRFSLTVAPAAAILTAVLVALSTVEAAFISLFVFPLVSFVLLVFEIDGSRFGHRLLTGRAKWVAVRAQAAQAAPAAGAAAGARAAAAYDTNATMSTDVPNNSFGLAVWKLMVSILAFSFICRSFDALPIETAGIFDLFGGSVLFALIVVGFTFLILAALLKDRFNVTMTYRLSLPLMMVGFAVLAFFINQYAAISLLLINVGYEFFDILSWILFGEVVRREQKSALNVFGLGVAFTFVGMALAYLFGDIFIGLFVHNETLITGVVLLCMVALVLVAFLVIPEGIIIQLAGARKQESDAANNADAVLELGRTAESAQGNPIPSIEESCGAIALTFKLTARESEVLQLLGRGRTLAIIARDLQIAKGTARTHIERVYAKLGVHKQQELIDLVEECSRKGQLGDIQEIAGLGNLGAPCPIAVAGRVTSDNLVSVSEELGVANKTHSNSR